MAAITSPAFWASIGVILTTVGVNIPNEVWSHLAELFAVIAAIIGIVRIWLGNGEKQQ